MKKIKLMFGVIALVGIMVLMSTTTAPKRTSDIVKTEIDSKIPYKGKIKAAPIIPLAIEYQMLLEQEQANHKRQHGPSVSTSPELGWCWAEVCNDCGFEEYDISIVCWICDGTCQWCLGHNVECYVGSQYFCEWYGPE